MARGNGGIRKPAKINENSDDLARNGDGHGLARAALNGETGVPDSVEAPPPSLWDATYFSLASGNLMQDWTNAGLITVNDSWSGVPSIVGYNGEPGPAAGVSPATVTGASSSGAAVVRANQSSSNFTNSSAGGGVWEFDSSASPALANPTIAFNGSGSADAPQLIFYLDATGRQSIRFQCNIRDLELTDNAVQQVQVQYRTSGSATWTNVVGGFFNDVTDASNTLITGVDLTLPADANNAATLQIRILTVNATGNDEFIGIDDIVISSSLLELNDAPTVSFNPPVAPVGGEILVNATTTDTQVHPSIAALSGGGYVVTWTSAGQEGASNFGIFAQRYNASGVAQGGEIHVNTTTANTQFDSSVTGLTGGGFVVVWHGNGAGDNEGIFAQRYDASGGALGVETRVNTTTGDTQESSAVGALSGGGYVVAWTSWNQDGSARGIYAQRYDANGVAQGLETLVNTTTAGDEYHPAVAGIVGGGYVIIWNGQDGDGGGVFLQRYNSAGVAQGGEIRANATAAGDQYYTDGNIAGNAVAGLTGGGFVVVWTGSDPSFSELDIYMQRFDANGVALGVETLVNTTTSGFQSDPTVTALASGGYVVTWEGSGPGDSGGVFSQRYDANGVAQGAETRVNATTGGSQSEQAVVGLADGGFIVAWQSPDGFNNGVYSQRYSGGFSANEQVPLDLKGAIAVGDVDAGSGVVTVTLSVDYGVMNATAGDSGATIVSGTGTGSLVVSGTLAQLAALLGAGGTSTLTYTANTDAPPASATLTVSANDGGNTGSGGAQIGQGQTTIAIAGANDAPVVANAIPDQHLVEDGTVDFQFAANAFNDPEGTALTYTATLSDNSPLPAWLGFDGPTRTFSGTPPVDFNGTITIKVTASDGTASVSDIFNLIVDPVNDPPTAAITATGLAPLGEDQVNTNESDTQQSPSVAGLDGGGHVVVWESYHNGVGSQVFFQLYDEDGNPLGGETLVDATGPGVMSAVSALGTGFVVVFTRYDGPGGDAEVYARRYDSSGTQLGGEIHVNTTTAGYQQDASVTQLADGGFLVVWMPDSTSLYGQRFDAAGSPTSPPSGEFQVNEFGGSLYTSPSVVGLPSGNWVVTWLDNFGTIYQRVYEEFSGLWGPQEIVGASTAFLHAPAIAVLADGGWVITWAEYPNGSASEYDILAHRYDASGASIGGEFAVRSDADSAFLGMPTIAALGDGGFVIGWSETDGPGTHIYARNYDAAGAAAGVAYLVNDGAPFGASSPAAAPLDGGGFAIVWASDNTQEGIYQQIYSAGFSVDEQTALDLKGSMSVSDVDSGGAVIEVTLSVDDGILTVEAGTSGASVADSGSASVTITGTLAQINALLGSDATSVVTYTHPGNSPPPSVTLTLAVDDLGATGIGGAMTDEATQTIHIIDTAESLSVGNLVFLDANNNGVFDAGDSGIDGVTVQLVDASDGSFLATTVTAGGGLFLFNGLDEGSYYLLIDGSEVPPGLVASSIVALADNNVDNDNNGVAGPIIGTTTFTLTAGGEPTGEDGNADTNLTVDFGFTYTPPTLDLDASGGGTGYVTSYTEGAFGVAVTDTDVDIVSAGPISSITITLTDHEAGDQLFVPPAGGWSNDDIVTTAYDSNTGILTLYIPFGGTASAADFEEALRYVSYRNTGINPTDDGTNPDRTITFTVNSPAGASNTATTTINITAVNTPATIGGVTTGNILEDTTLSTGGQLTVSDPDGPDSFLTLSGAPGSNNYGSFTLSAAGLWSYAVNNAAIQFLGQGDIVTDTIFAKAADGTGQLLTVTITGVNDAATISGTDTGTVTEDNGTPATGTLSVTDVDQGEASFAVQNSVATAHGFFSIDGLGNWSFTLNDSLDDHIPGGEQVIETVTVSSLDGTTHEIDITITGVDDAANFGGDFGGEVTEDNDLNASGTLGVIDADDGESVFVEQALTASAYGNFTLNAAGEWTYSLSNGAVQHLGQSSSITDSFNVTTAGGDVQTVTITIYGQNDTAQITGDSTGEVTEDGDTQDTGTLNVTDADAGQSSFQATSGSTTYGSWSINSGGTWTYTLNNAHPDVQALNSGQQIVERFDVLAADGTAQTVFVTINGQDEPAVTPPSVDLDGGAGGFDYSGSYTEGGAGAPIGSAIDVTEGTLPITSATITLTDPGGEGSLAVGTLPLTITNVSGNDLVVQLVGVGASAADWEAALAAITFASSSDNPDDYGNDTSHTITVTLSDGVTTSNTATATIGIVAISDAPVVTDFGAAVTYTEGTPVLLDLDSDATISDVDNLDFDGGNLSFGSFAPLAEDFIYVHESGSVGLSGSDVVVDGFIIGTIAASGPGELLRIEFNADATVERVQTLLHSIAYSSTNADNPTAGTRTFTWILNDGDGGGTGGGVDVTVVAVNDDPRVDDLDGDEATFTEGDAFAYFDVGPEVLVSDPDSANFADGALVIDLNANEDGGNDTFFIVENARVTFGADLGGGSFELEVDGVHIGTYSGVGAGGQISAVYFNANATAERVEQVLRAYAFSTTAVNPSTATRDVDYTLYDGDGGTTTFHTTMAVVAVNDAPVGQNNIVFATEDTPYVFTLADFPFTDEELDALGSVVIVDPPAAGQLLFDGVAMPLAGAGATISASDIVSGRLTFVPAADASGSGYASFTFQLVDENNGVDLTPNVMTIDVAAVEDDPAINVPASDVYWTEHDPAVLLDVNLTVTDPDGPPDIDGATVTISSGYVAGEDLLTWDSALATSYTITASYIGGVLTFSGTASLAEYEAVLRTVAYANSGGDTPTGGDRVIDFAVSSGPMLERPFMGLSIPATNAVPIPVGGDSSVTVHVEAVNDTPTVTIATLSGIPVGGELLVNVTTEGTQANPSVAMLANGDYVVIWASFEEGSLYARRYDASGGPLGGEVAVTSGGPVMGPPSAPSIAALPGGGYVVTWQVDGDLDGDGYGAFAQLFDATGAPVGGAVLVNSFTTGTQWQPSVAGLSDGGYVIVWESLGQDGSSSGIYAQRYNSAGVAQAGEILVNTFTAGQQSDSSVAGLSGGGYVVTWRSQNQDAPGGTGIYSQRYDAMGAPAGGEILVNTTTAGSQTQPWVASLSAGGYVVCWAGAGSGDFNGIFLQRYDSTGAAVGGEIRANTTTGASQLRPTVEGLTDGGFVVSWLSDGQDGSGLGVYAQRYDSTGATVGGEVRVNTFTAGSQAEPVITGLPGGDWVVLWSSPDQDGSGVGVYSQHYGHALLATEQVALDLKGAIAVDDIDAGAGTITVTIAVDYGVIDATAGLTGVTLSGEGTGTLIVTGTLAQIQDFLSTSSASTLSYNPNTDTPPASAELSVTINDNGNTGSDPGLTGDSDDERATATATIVIAAVNDAPALTDFGPSVTFLENTVNATPQLLDFDVTFSDPEGNFNGGALTVTGMLAEDFIGVNDQGTGPGQIGVSGLNVTYEGVVIGTITDAVGLFSVDFNAAATSAAIDALIQNLTYSNNSDTPTPSRTLTLNITDADGASLVQPGPVTYAPLTGAGNPFDGVDVGFNSSPSFADLDGDGDMDAVVGTDFGTLRAFRNNGDTTFTELTGAGNPFDGVNVGFISAPDFVDLDGDGDMDAVIGEFYGTLHSFRNDAGVFTELTGVANPFYGVDVGGRASSSFADLDGDGDMDAVVGAGDGTLHTFDNDGGTFTELTGAANPFNGVDVNFNAAPSFTDLDGDGDVDAVVGGFHGTLRSFRNDGGVFTELTGVANPFDGVNVGSDSAPSFVDLDDDGDMDVVVGAANGTLLAFENTTPRGQTITVNVTPESDNTPPTVGANAGLTLDEGATATITAVMLDFNDAEQADGAITYTITSAATNGTLRLGATVLGVGDTFTQADVNAGLVTYEHDGGETTSASFGFSVSDGIETVPGQSFAITVDPVNDAPTLDDFGPSVTFLENTVNAAPQLLDFDVTFADAEENFDGGTLTLTGGLPEDVLGIRNQGIALGEIGVSGANVTYGGVVIGSFAGGSSLTVTFNAAATAEAVDALIQNLTYANADDTPTASRTLTLNVTDADGADLTLPGPMTLAPLTGPGNPFDGVVTGRYARPAFADLDGDGDLDAVIGHRDGIRVFRNGTDGASGAFTELTGGDNPLNGFSNFTAFTRNFPNFVDFDADGDLDLVVGTNINTIRAFRNTAAPGADAAFTELTGGTNPFNGVTGGQLAPAFVDLDNDGDLDAVVGERFGTFRSFENTAGPGAPFAFTELTGSNNPFNGLDSGDYGTPNFADLDGDGDLDMVSGENGAVLHAFRNNGDGTFTEVFGGANPFTPFNGTYSAFGQRAAAAFVDIDGDGDIDAVVGSLSYAVSVFQNTAPQGQQIVVNVTAENDAPTVGANTGLTLDEGATQTITAAMLDYNDPEQGDGAITYMITSAATNGTLRVGSTVLGVGGTFTQADLNAGLVSYQHNGGETTSASFGFSVSDGIATVPGQSFAIIVNPVDDSPTIANLDDDEITFIENGAPMRIDVNGDALVADVDSTDFDGGFLEVTYGPFHAGEDLIGIAVSPDSTVTLSSGINVGSIVSVGGIAIGTISAGSPGSQTFRIDFDADATPATVSTLLRALTYQNLSNDPSPLTGAVVVTLNDGDGADSVGVSVNVDITAVNDAPVLGNLQGNSVTYTEQQAAPRLLDAMSNATVTDIDSDDFDGGSLRIAIGAGGVAAEDQLVVVTNANVTVSGNALLVGGTQIATFTGGTGGADLVFTFDADATPAAVQALIRAIGYTNSAGDVPTAGPRTITWTLVDGDGVLNSGNDTATVTSTLNVVAVDDPPAGVDGTIAINEDEQYHFTAADFGFSDPEGNPATSVRIETLPTNGIIYFDPDGSGPTAAFTINEGFIASMADLAAGRLYYIPDADEFGEDMDSFTFAIGGSGGYDPVPNTITFDVAPLNDPAVISGDAAGVVTEAGGVANGNPGDADDSGDLNAADVDNTTDAWQAVVAPTATANGYGTYTLTAAGVWTYVLNNNHAAVQALNGSATLSDSFTVLTQDGTSQLVTVTINAQNDSATITGDASASVTEAGGVNNGTAGVLTDTGDLNAADVDNVADSWVAAASGTASIGGYGSYSLSATGVWVYTLNNNHAAVQALNGLATLTDTFTAVTIDGTSQTVTVTINAQNDNAVIGGDAFGHVTEAGGVGNGTPGTQTDSGDLSATDVDNSADAWQAVAAPAATANGYGTFTLTAAGVWTYTLNDAHPSVQALNGSATLTDTFTVLTQDGTSQVVSVTIHAQNDSATITGDFFGDVTEAGGAANATPGDPDDSGNMDSGDLDNTADAWQAVAAGAATANGFGTYALSASGVWTYTLNDNHASVQALNGSATLTDSFTALTEDGTSQLVTVTIHAQNDNAVISGDSAGDVTEAGGVANGTPGDPDDFGDLNSTDVDNANDSWVGVAAGTATLGGYGTYSLSFGGIWTYTLNDNHAAVQALNGSATLVDTFTAVTADGTMQTVSVTIHAQDDFGIAQDDAFTTDEGTPLSGNVFPNNGSGPDTDIDNPPTVTHVNGSSLNLGVPVLLASGATVTLNANGNFIYDPNHAFDRTPTALSGASNTPAHDSFTYTIIGGDTATVNITVLGLDTDDLALGTAGVDIIDAGAGNDIIDGLGGADTLAGGGGNDFIFVSADDTVVEANGGGYDNVLARETYILTAGAHVEVLSTDNHEGVASINLTGNALGNILIGNAAGNILDGGGGSDRLAGFGGDDFLIVDSADDIVVEDSGGGYDNVLARSSYTLTAGAHVEVLSTDNHAGTAFFALTGNELNNIVIGNAGSNLLDGGNGGIDRLAGFGGNDFLVVDTGDVVIEDALGGYDNVLARSHYELTFGQEVEILSTADHGGTQSINLTGNEYNNILIGNAGSNILDGSFGSDRLDGLGGIDTFAFTTGLGAFNIDTIIDFDGGDGGDTIRLENAVFTGLAGGVLDPNAFVLGPVATTADHRIIYDATTGALYFDADGSGTASAQIQFAILDGGPVLNSADFFVI